MAKYQDKDKKVKIGSVTLPAASASLNIEGQEVEDSNFLTSGGYVTRLIGLQKWGLDASGKVSGSAGYLTTIKQAGTPTSMTGEACSLVTGKIYQVTDATKRVLDEATALVVKDGVTDISATQVDSVDYLFGIVTLKAAYTVVGSITVGGKYIPLAAIAQYKDYGLSLKGAVLDATDFTDAQANSGTRVHKINLIDVSLSVGRFDDLAHTFETLLSGRTAVMIEVGIANATILCRGWYYLSKAGKAGDITALESESLDFVLAGRSNTNFSYSASVAVNAGLTALLTAFFARTSVVMHYLPGGTTGVSGTAYVAGMDFKGSLEGVDEFTVSLVSGGALATE